MHKWVVIVNILTKRPSLSNCISGNMLENILIQDMHWNVFFMTAFSLASSKTADFVCVYV